jgi:hypothetical protein
MSRNDSIQVLFWSITVNIEEVCSGYGFLSGTWGYLEVGGKCGMVTLLEKELTLLNY